MVDLVYDGYLDKSIVKTDNVARHLSVSSRLRSQFFYGWEGPVSQKRYVVEKNGFHIRNLRGRFTLNCISEQNKKIIFFRLYDQFV